MINNTDVNKKFSITSRSKCVFSQQMTEMFSCSFPLFLLAVDWARRDPQSKQKGSDLGLLEAIEDFRESLFV